MLGAMPAGIQGYELARQSNQAQGMNELSQASGAMGLLAKIREEQQQQELKSFAAQSGGDPRKLMEALLKSGNPRAIELATHMKGLLPDQKLHSVGAGGLYDPSSGTVIAPLGVPEKQTPTGLSRLLAEKAKLPPGDPRHSFYDNAIRKESETAKQISPTVVMPRTEPPVQQHTDEKGLLWERERGGSWKPALGPDGTQLGSRPSAAASAAARKAGEGVKNVESLSDDIDTLVTMLEQNPNIAGGRGMITRGIEAASGFIDPTQAPTDAHLFESRIGDLKTRLQLLRADKRFSKEAMARMDKIIQGTGLGQNAATSIATLRDMQDKMNRDVAGSAKADKFTVGQTYRDANGNTAKYLGNGNWE